MKPQVVIWLCLLVIVTITSAAEAGSLRPKKKKDSRIVNGQAISISEAPYTVQLKTRDGFTFCGGTLVTARHVISAAHCLKFTKPSDIMILAGLTFSNVTNGGEARLIAETFLPQGYNFVNQMSVNDIVVFRLDEPMPMTRFIRAIGLCDRDLVAGMWAQVSGWGATYERGPTSAVLNTIRVPIVDREECVDYYSDVTTIYGSMVCAANLDTYQDACQGDSGGPLVVAGKLCGVVSWGRSCGRNDSPGIYTSINAMRDFIDRAISA